MARPIGFLTAAASVAILGTASSVEAAPCVGLVAIVAGQLGATCDDGTAPIGIFGTVLLADSSGFQDHTTADPYDYVLTGPPAVLPAGNTADFAWIHEADVFGSESGAPSDGARWLFPFSATEFILYPSLDHPPIPNEGLEGTLWGSSDGGANWILGTLTHIWEDGFHPGFIDDDYASLWQFSAPVDLISATHGLGQGSYLYFDLDVEIDAVAAFQRQVPEPGTLFLLGGGLLGATLARRRRR